MIQKLKSLLRGEKRKKASDYSGLSDFLMHAPDAKKTSILREAARLANEDQMRTFEKARLKTNTR